MGEKESIKLGQGSETVTSTIGEILLEEFMEPMSISAYKLAQEIYVPVSRI
ncbi:helix-turn-helix domain-containing protein [Novisyntrophococcus fermenticellae]|uniref:hypothetical protein n=1 Tax=Novisyntrophococcus fermenticellae TaxID=2068655 RepID=UPI001E55DB25|nr:hypothetical protein [Novisyntrophococcus fermenticellae]